MTPAQRRTLETFLPDSGIAEDIRAALADLDTARAEAAALREEVEAMRAVVEEAERVYTTCEPTAPMLVQHLGECLDALRARKVGG